MLQLIVVVGYHGGQFATVGGRVFNMFCYFTIQSNVIVGVTCLLLALKLDRRSTVFRVFRLIGLIDIVITGVVFHIALAHLQELNGHAAVADQLLHTVVPILAVLGWLLFGPRGLTSPRIAVLASLYPICWAAFTLIRGPISDFYPYPFIDVRKHGYPIVFLNISLVALLFLLLAGGAILLDRWLSRTAGIAATSRTAEQP